MAGFVIGKKMTTVETATIWSESTVHQKSKQHIINSHIASKLGGYLFLNDKLIGKLRKNNPAVDRTNNVTKYEKKESIAKTSTTSRTKKTAEKDVSFYVKFLFQNTLL